MEEARHIENWSGPSFETFEANTNGAVAAPVKSLRRDAFQQFSRLGFPTTQNEDWKYTNISAIAGRRFELPRRLAEDAFSLMDLQPCVLPVLEKPRAVFVNGFFSPRLSSLSELDPGVQFTSLGEVFRRAPSKEMLALLNAHALHEEQPFAALNSAFASDGAAIVFKKGAGCSRPLHLLFVTVGVDASYMVHPRVLLIVEQGASANVVESFASTGGNPCLTNSLTQALVGEGARLEHTKIQCESTVAYHIGLLPARLKQGSVFTSNVFQFGGALVRNEIRPILEGESIECYLNGLSAINGTQHVDNHTVLEHAMPRCFSREIYKGIYGDSARGVFSGTITVRPNAQKTNAIQNNQSVLLSPEATVETRPQLKIWADDVKCTHGATVGQLDEDALFYIRSRGISEETARHLLIHAFASEVVNHVSDAEVKSYLERLLKSKLGAELA